MTSTYHYHAVHFSIGGAEEHFDGVVVAKEPITDADSYAEMRESLKKEVGLRPDERLTVTSLTYLGSSGGH
jgi:hypothetical protein